MSWMQVRNEKARKYLAGMRKKHPMPFAEKFPKADPASLNLLKRLLAFDPKDRPTAEEVHCKIMASHKLRIFRICITRLSFSVILFSCIYLDYFWCICILGVGGSLLQGTG